MSYLKAFSTTSDPLPFQKIPCHFIALLKDNAIFNVSFQFGTILLCVSFTSLRQICINNYPPNSSLFGIWIGQKSFTETRKFLCNINIVLCKVSSMLAHIPYIVHHMHWPSFRLGSTYHISNLPSMTILQICLGEKFLTCWWFLWRFSSYTVNNVPVKR